MTKSLHYLMRAFAPMLLVSIAACDDGDPAGPGPNEGIVEQTAVLYTFPQATLVQGAAATLLRTDSTLTVTVDTHGLIPGHTYTLWWTIFNAPEQCENPDEPAAGFDLGLEGLSVCGEMDLFIDSAAGSAFFASGAIADSDGRAIFSATVSINDDVSDCDFIDFGICGDGLVNPFDAEIHSFLRSHGPPIPDLINEQLETFAGGCTPESSFGLGDGPNECDNPQFAVFSP